MVRFSHRFENGGVWRAGEISTTEGLRLWCKVPGEGIIGPFHRALDRDSLWRPMAVNKKGGGQGMLRPVACATSEPVLSSPPIEA